MRKKKNQMQRCLVSFIKENDCNPAFGSFILSFDHFENQVNCDTGQTSWLKFGHVTKLIVFLSSSVIRL